MVENLCCNSRAGNGVIPPAFSSTVLIAEPRSRANASRNIRPSRETVTCIGGNSNRATTSAWFAVRNGDVVRSDSRCSDEHASNSRPNIITIRMQLLSIYWRLRASITTSRGAPGRLRQPGADLATASDYPDRQRGHAAALRSRVVHFLRGLRG